jgi:hypothetical protein
LELWLDYSLYDNINTFNDFDDLLQSSTQINFTQFCNVLTVQDISEQNSIKIYPNPVTDVINIYTQANLKYRTNFYDLNGKLISSSKNKSVIEIHTLSLGLYLIEITDLDSGHKVVEKIIKAN